MRKAKKCSICGEEFIPTHNAQRICSKIHTRRCEVCGKEFVITSSTTPTACCSKECSQIKRESTMLSRYGVRVPTENPEIYEKAKKSILKKYGVEHAAQAQSVKDKVSQKFMDKYGVPWPTMMDDFAEKSKQTCLDRYGVEFTSQIPGRTERMLSTNMERYGAPTPMQSSKIRKSSYDTRCKIVASDGTHLDSLYEKAVYEFFLKLGIAVEREIPRSYTYGDVDRVTYVDFKVGDLLFEVKGGHLMQGCFDYQGVPIDVKLDVYKKHHVIVITDELGRDKFGKPNSSVSNGLKYLNKCPEPLIGVDISLFTETPEFPYRDDRPHCFYDVRVDGQKSAHEAFYDKEIRWKMILNRIQYSGGFIDAKQILNALNVTKTCKQPSWFSKQLAKNIIQKYCTSTIIFDAMAGWGARADAANELHRSYVGVDFNKELVDWHHSKGRTNIVYGDAREFKYDKPCSIFICPPYSDPETGRCFEDYNFDGFEDRAKSLSQCDWLKVVLKNVPNASEAVMVCKIVDKGWERYVVDTIKNQSHFGTNYEYVIVINNEDFQEVLKE